jgi:hypothetical protein
MAKNNQLNRFFTPNQIYITYLYYLIKIGTYQLFNNKISEISLVNNDE